MKNLGFVFILALLISACGKPIADFTYSGADKPAPAEVDFENKSKKAESYEWDFGDGTKSSEASPKHKYASSGNYTVKLTAKKGQKMTEKERKVFIEAPVDCLVELETDFGTMTIKLFNSTPKHRDNFIKLVEEGFYDGLLFHRVINGFMVQGGDPNSRGAKANASLGSGGPGYQIDAEFEANNAHVKGALSAARMGDNVNPEKKSSGSQFYVVQGRSVTGDMLDQMEAKKGIRYTKEQREAYLANGGTPFLDAEYTVFGQVIKGMDVIDKIANVETNRADRPVKDVKMKMKVVK